MQLTILSILVSGYVPRIFHYKFCACFDLINLPCLHGWCLGQGEQTWQAAQDHSSSLWAATLEKISAGTSGVQWDQRLLACMDASISRISWSAYQQRVHSSDYFWTLVHGDFHPANILWRWPDAAQLRNCGSNEHKEIGSPVLLDFEVVGLGSGAQDLAQYLISHACAADRRAHEEELLQDYYAHLTGTGSCANTGSGNSFVNPAEYSYEQCKKDYVEGGVCRWVWLLALLSGMCPDPLTQYFHDQVLDFLVDHNVTPENIAMPRV